MLETAGNAPVLVLHALDGFSSWNPPQLLLSLVSLMTAFSAYMVSRLLAVAPMITLPFSYIVLFAFSMFSNYLGQNIFMSGVTDVQKIVACTMLAQGFVVPLLFLTFKTGELSRKAF